MVDERARRGPTTGRAAEPWRGSGGRLRRLAELLALTGLAVAQPVLDVTGRSPDFFVFRRPTPWQMRMLVAIVAFGPPLLLWLVELALGKVSHVAERVAHLVFVGLLCAVLVSELGKKVGLFPGRVLGVIALAVGAVLAAQFASRQRVRELVAYAAPAPLAFALLFTVATPAGALLAGSGATGDGSSGSGGPPVVMLLLDELPTRALLDASGQIDPKLFPNFAELARASTWYPNMTAVSGFTPFAVPAVLSGLYPQRALAPAHNEYPNNVFTMLRGRYQLKAYESITQLCPPADCEDVDAGRSTGLKALIGDTAKLAGEIISPYEPEKRTGAEFAEEPTAPREGGDAVRFRFKEGGKNQPGRLVSFLEGIEDDRVKPSLHFLHILLPHVPYRYLPSGTVYQENGSNFALAVANKKSAFLRTDEAGVMTVFKQRMLMQLAYVDGLLGDLIARMKEVGTWDKSLVLLTADHGNAYLPGQRGRHLDTDNVAELAYIPLFIKKPGQTAPVVDQRNAQSVDVLPTLAAHLGTQLDFKVDGVSLLGPPRPTQAKQWFDTPGQPRPIDGSRWSPALSRGFASDITDPPADARGLYRVGPHRVLVGRTLETLNAGPPSPIVASLVPRVDQVDPGSGQVPAMIFGKLSAAPAPESSWLVVSVNGTIAGTVLAAKGNSDEWHFLGMVDEAYFMKGRNDVRLHIVGANQLHVLQNG